MPFDLEAIEKGFGEVDVPWETTSITIRYRADLNNRAIIAMKRAMVGVPMLGGAGRFPDIEAILDELIKTLLPSGEDIDEGMRGWDVTRGGKSVPITFDTLVDLPPGLPPAILSSIFRDINDPNRRRPYKRGSQVVAVSAPEASPTTTASSATPNGQGSHPGISPDSATRPAGLVGASSFDR